MQDLNVTITTMIQSAGAEAAVACRTIDGEEIVMIAPDEKFHAASTMKIPVMIELFRQAEAGQIQLDDVLPVANRFQSIADGSVYSLALEHKGEEPLHDSQEATLAELCEVMIAVSSNLATNLLIDHLGIENIQATLRDLGAEAMRVLRGVEDIPAFESGLNNTTTARALLIQLEHIAQQRIISAAACDSMLAILKKQTFVDGIPADLPEGTVVAHKTGEITAHHHDAGIVYAERPFILAVLTRGLSDRQASGRLIAQIASTIYAHCCAG